jgi:hypothetical protein
MSSRVLGAAVPQDSTAHPGVRETWGPKNHRQHPLSNLDRQALDLHACIGHVPEPMVSSSGETE